MVCEYITACVFAKDGNCAALCLAALKPPLLLPVHFSHLASKVILSEGVCDGRGLRCFSWAADQQGDDGETGEGGCGTVVIYCVTRSSVSRCLARGAAHGRGAVGAGALPHSQSARQLQLLEEGSPCDLNCLRTLAGAQRQHAAHHTQLHTERRHTVH